MAARNYQRQQLAAYAAGYINGSGASRYGFGCAMTRLGVGMYAMILPTGAALQNRKTFSFVAVKGTTALVGNPNDNSDFVKEVDLTDINGDFADGEFEIVLYSAVED
jgi:hypothetical protein